MRIANKQSVRFTVGISRYTLWSIKLCH